MASTSDINSIPKKYIPVPFANGADSAYVNNIPQTRASGDPQNKATWNVGFPPITMQPVNADGTGGIPPSGADMNGVLNTLSSHAYTAQYGVSYDWDSNIASNLGGYPSGAIVAYPVGNNANKTLYLSLQENNTSNPTSGAWKPLYTTPPFIRFPNYVARENRASGVNHIENRDGWIYILGGKNESEMYIYINGVAYKYARDYADGFSLSPIMLPIQAGTTYYIPNDGVVEGFYFIPCI
jgi:hypothetical protein